MLTDRDLFILSLLARRRWLRTDQIQALCEIEGISLSYDMLMRRLRLLERAGAIRKVCLPSPMHHVVTLGPLADRYVEGAEPMRLRRRVLVEGVGIAVPQALAHLLGLHDLEIRTRVIVAGGDWTLEPRFKALGKEVVPDAFFREAAFVEYDCATERRQRLRQKWSGYAALRATWKRRWPMLVVAVADGLPARLRLMQQEKIPVPHRVCAATDAPRIIAEVM